jgi:hypothetical protein
MSARNLFSERFGMLMACASPGSALAYHLGSDAGKAAVVQRDSAVSGPAQPKSGSGWRGLLEQLEQWSWERQMKAQEAYLSQATDLCDLEARMRRIDSTDGAARGQALR